MSKLIMLIRHAEKPVGGRGGVSVEGRPDDNSLSVVGWQRAGALVPFFSRLGARTSRGLIATPRHIFAARPTRGHASTRPADTVAPLADALGLRVDDRWSDIDAVEDVAATLRAMRSPELVCWQHDHIPVLGRAILGSNALPKAWAEDCFNVVWVFLLRDRHWTLEQVPQKLLAGD
ncbi:hypothetical protein SNE35_24040 [Paucibacter sp. R3-3]|uniref:Histidine phosphatase family protein n=1 Tax=Roseateles agri TaxID=3098619 RepID=A0ABU5DMQ0_9BURK|nr:hypothetical protein [Paucibacter sp. R3-3]MDY0747595.1 hypothetical protein [Paucibacter sp. R3-3]